MAIRYDADFNAKIRREVRNFNKRRNRMEKRGFKNIPPAVRVSDLKARYSVRSDLVREVNRLRNFRRGDILKQVETQGGAKSTNWELQYLKGNLKNAKQYFEKEYERVSKRVGRFPGERTYLDTIRAKIDLLDKNLTYMSQSEFRSAKAAISEFTDMPRTREAQYRGFLSEVDWVMEMTGITKEKRDAFFKKFNTLTPSQFLYAYDNNDIINRIFSLYRKNEGEPELADTEENAEDLVNILIDDADEIVKDAKLNSD